MFLMSENWWLPCPLKGWNWFFIILDNGPPCKKIKVEETDTKAGTKPSTSHDSTNPSTPQNSKPSTSHDSTKPSTSQNSTKPSQVDSNVKPAPAPLVLPAGCVFNNCSFNFWLNHRSYRKWSMILDTSPWLVFKVKYWKYEQMKPNLQVISLNLCYVSMDW